MNGDWIKKEVKELYGISPCLVEEIPRGSADIYLVLLNSGQKYIFKVFQEKMTEDRVQKELLMTEHLHKKGFIVPEYIGIKGNSSYYGFTSNNRIAVLQKYISGKVLDDNKATPKQMTIMAELYAEILIAMKDYPSPLPSFSFEQLSRKNIIDSIEEAQKLQLTVNDKDVVCKINDKIKWMQELLEIDYDFFSHISVENSHGDYNPFQIIFEPEGFNAGVAILDFASAKKMPVVFELVRCYLYASPNALFGQVKMEEFISFIKVFNDLFTLNEYDLRYMFYPYYIKSVSNLFGYREYLLTGDNTFKFLGDQIYYQCKAFHKNIKDYSNQLIKGMKGDI